MKAVNGKKDDRKRVSETLFLVSSNFGKCNISENSDENKNYLSEIVRDDSRISLEEEGDNVESDMELYGMECEEGIIQFVEHPRDE